MLSILWIELHNSNHPSCSRRRAPKRRGPSSEAKKGEPIGADSPSSRRAPEAAACGGTRGAGPARLSSQATAGRRVSSLGGDRGVAGRVNRGDVHLCRFERPDKQRPVLILTCQNLISHLSTITVAPVTSTIRDVLSEVILDVDDGMKSRCAVNLHNAVTISQERLGKRVASLSHQRMQKVCAAIRFSLGCG
jgi:mRNA interferase MazF